MAKPLSIVGFSTRSVGARDRHQWKLFDEELVKQDLLNHFNTRRGQRIGRPDIGCDIWSYIMAQRTEQAIQGIEEEIARVCNFDTRVIFKGVKLVEMNRGIIAYVDLFNNITKGSFTFAIKFDERQSMASRG